MQKIIISRILFPEVQVRDDDHLSISSFTALFRRRTHSPFCDWVWRSTREYDEWSSSYPPVGGFLFYLTLHQ